MMISLYLMMVFLMAFLRSSLVIIFQGVMFNFFASCNNFNNVLIYFSCNPLIRLQKICFLKYTTHLFMPPQKILHHHLNHSTCYTAGFLHQCVHTFRNTSGMVVFTLFAYRVNLKHCYCIAIHAIWNNLTMDIHLNVFFPCFQLTMHLFTSFFTGSVISFLNNCNTTSFQMPDSETPIPVPQKH